MKPDYALIRKGPTCKTPCDKYVVSLIFNLVLGVLQVGPFRISAYNF